MLKKKRIVVAFAAIVLASLLASLLAGEAALVAPKTFTDGVQGVEVSAGQIDGNIREGVTFVGYADGRFPGALYASLNYTPRSLARASRTPSSAGRGSLRVPRACCTARSSPAGR